VLTPLQEKLGEVLGLALAAPVALDHVAARAEDPALAELRRDAEAVQARCAAIAEAWGEETRWDVLAHAQYVQRKAGEMLGAWFKAATDAVQAYEFLAMAEAGEVAATAALGALGEGDGSIDELVAWALSLQERHLQHALARTAEAASAVPAGTISA
jgi:hypothetical protein